MMWLENYEKTTGKMNFPTKAEQISLIKKRCAERECHV